jgi:hypothetical protein
MEDNVVVGKMYKGGKWWWVDVNTTLPIKTKCTSKQAAIDEGENIARAFARNSGRMFNLEYWDSDKKELEIYAWSYMVEDASEV